MSLFQRFKTPFADAGDDQSSEDGQYVHSVGEALRERRRELGLDLESVGEALRIKAIYLAAIEQGRSDDLPGPAYAFGFIRAYANYLGLDGEYVLESYKAQSSGTHAPPDLTLPMPLGERSLPGTPILLVAAILVLCGYGTWYYLSTGERNRPERVTAVPAELQRDAAAPLRPGAPAPAAVPAPATSPTAANPAAAAGPAPSRNPQLASGVGAANEGGGGTASPGPAAAPATPPEPPVQSVASAPSAESPMPAGSGATTPNAASGAAASPATAIDIRALSDCWIQVRAPDQSIVFSRVLKAGETYRVPRTGLFLRTGNAGALAIAVDGKSAPPIGGVGTLRRNVALDPVALLAGTAVHG